MANQLNTALAILRRRQVQELTGLSCSSIYALMTEGKFPRPVKLGARAVGWRSDMVQSWIASRVEASHA